jgi:hypothetical protein
MNQTHSLTYLGYMLAMSASFALIASVIAAPIAR